METFAIPVAVILEINRIARVRAIPGAPEFLIGLINFHGATAPVVSLKRLLGVSCERNQAETMWLAVRFKGKVICLGIDGIVDYVELEQTDLDPVPPFTKNLERVYIDRIARWEDRLVPVLDINRILQDKEYQTLEAIIRMAPVPET